MFCKNCGAELPEGSRFCTSCGCDQTVNPVVGQYNAAAHGERPSTYLLLSILVTIFCCVPFGIVGIVYAAKVDSYWNSGRYEEARDFSRKARTWSLLGLFSMLLLWLAYIILIVAGVSWATWWDNSLYSI